MANTNEMKYKGGGSTVYLNPDDSGGTLQLNYNTSSPTNIFYGSATTAAFSNKVVTMNAEVTINGNSNILNHITVSNNTSSATVYLDDANKGICYSGTHNGGTYFDTTNHLPSDGAVLFGYSDVALGTTTGSINKIVLYANSSSQVGINTTSPAYTLDVNGTGNFSSQVNVKPKIYVSDNTLWGAPSNTTIYGGNGDRIILWAGAAGGDYPYSIGLDSSSLWLNSGGSGSDIKNYVNGTLLTTLNSSSLTLTSGVQLIVNNTTIGTLTASSGAINCKGGIYVAKKSYFKDDITMASTGTLFIGNPAAATSTSTSGAINCQGGIYAGNDCYITGLLNVNSNDFTTYTVGKTGISNMAFMFPGGYTITSVDSLSQPAVSIYTSNYIISKTGIAYNTLVTTSDIRIKNNITKINYDNVTNIFRKLEPVIYNYIDTIQQGNTKTYGFIAQDVIKILPEAIKLRNETIPNVYSRASISDNLITLIDTDTTKLESDASGNYFDLCIYVPKDDEKEEEITVKITKIIDDKTLIITSEKPIKSDNIFVYGQRVNNFHYLNKEIIFSLNVGVTQKLCKTIETQQETIEKQQQKIDYLQSQLTSITEFLQSKFDYTP